MSKTQDPVSRCKICLREFADIDEYNKHLERFEGEPEKYAAHGKGTQTAKEPQSAAAAIDNLFRK